MFSYIHIPFCESKCKYCRFASFVKNDEEKNHYCDFLVKSILDFSMKDEKLDSVYFGGGTPTSLSDMQLYAILYALKQKFGFKNNIEITLETTPQNITKKNLEFWIYKLGINRLSIGIQSLNDSTLKEIGRISKDKILEKLDILKEYLAENDLLDFNVNFDFIIGLPYAKSGQVCEDLEFVIKNYSSFLKHISIYMLEEQYYPEKWQKLTFSEEEFLDEYDECCKLLYKKGFYRYEISNFSKPGFSCKHNLAYWRHKDYIGFGLGAHSFVNGIRFANANNFKDYYSGKLEYFEKIDEEKFFMEKVIFDIRTVGLASDLYVNLNKAKLQKFIDGGFMFKLDDKILLTNKGILVLDYILRELF